MTNTETVLRDSADDFVMVAAVYAELVGRPLGEVIEESLRDAAARQNERGVLGGDDE